MNVKTLLLISAAGEARQGLVARLAREGFLVTTADDARSAQAGLAAQAPGAILIDLPADQQRRIVRKLSGHPRLGMIPRFLVTAPLGPASPPLPAAAVFERPLDPEHLVRALAALYPQRQTAPATPVEVSPVKEEHIRAAIDLVQSLRPPVLVVPEPPAEGPSPRAASVAQTFALELRQLERGNAA